MVSQTIVHYSPRHQHTPLEAITCDTFKFDSHAANVWDVTWPCEVSLEMFIIRNWPGDADPVVESLLRAEKLTKCSLHVPIELQGKVPSKAKFSEHCWDTWASAVTSSGQKMFSFLFARRSWFFFNCPPRAIFRPAQEVLPTMHQRKVRSSPCCVYHRGLGCLLSPDHWTWRQRDENNRKIKLYDLVFSDAYNEPQENGKICKLKEPSRVVFCDLQNLTVTVTFVFLTKACALMDKVSALKTHGLGTVRIASAAQFNPDKCNFCA